MKNKTYILTLKDIIMVATIVVMSFLLLKGCREVDYLKGVNKQNIEAIHDTVSYFEGSYTKKIIILNDEKLAKKDKKIAFLIDEIDSLKSKPKDIVVIEPKYNVNTEVNSGLVEVDDGVYELTFSDTNLVRTINGVSKIRIKREVDEVVVDNNLTLTERISIEVDEEKMNINENFNFGLGVSLVESDDDFQEVVVTPYSLLNDTIVEIPQNILSIPMIKSVRIEKPSFTEPPKWYLTGGVSITTGVNPFNNEFGFVVGPSVSLGRKINLTNIFKPE